MTDQSNTGYNASIKCSVSECAYHANSKNYCSLNEIQVGACKSHPTSSDCTECASFTSGSTK
ncbi:MAG: DUF1540 domain-containing protein [Oscillospiraceae bacterium]|jgi:hypothetical protein